MTRPTPLRIVSDFDGVWTDPAREAAAVHHTMVSELARLSGKEEAVVESDLVVFADAIRERPWDYGWRIDGRLASFVDEDYFCLQAALGQFIEESDGLAASYRRAIEEEHESPTKFADHCYFTTCSRFRETVSHDLTRGAEPLVRWLLGRGVRLTFATNAPAEKIIGWFAHLGLVVVDAATGDPDAPLRVRGRAGKQWLGGSLRRRTFGGRSVEVDRPQYLALLEEERPDLVIGDVLSLDLAVPLALRATGHPAAPRSTALVVRRPAPRWVHDAIGPALDQVDHLVPHVTALPRLVLELEAAADSGRLAPAQPADSGVSRSSRNST